MVKQWQTIFIFLAAVYSVHAVPLNLSNALFSYSVDLKEHFPFSFLSKFIQDAPEKYLFLKFYFLLKYS